MKRKTKKQKVIKRKIRRNIKKIPRNNSACCLSDMSNDSKDLDTLGNLWDSTAQNPLIRKRALQDYALRRGGKPFVNPQEEIHIEFRVKETIWQKIKRIVLGFFNRLPSVQ